MTGADGAGSYLRQVLLDGARPVQQRGGVRELLGVPLAGAVVVLTTVPRHRSVLELSSSRRPTRVRSQEERLAAPQRVEMVEEPSKLWTEALLDQMPGQGTFERDGSGGAGSGGAASGGAGSGTEPEVERVPVKGPVTDPAPAAPPPEDTAGRHSGPPPVAGQDRAHRVAEPDSPRRVLLEIPPPDPAEPAPSGRRDRSIRMRTAAAEPGDAVAPTRAPPSAPGLTSPDPSPPRMSADPPEEDGTTAPRGAAQDLLPRRTSQRDSGGAPDPTPHRVTDRGRGWDPGGEATRSPASAPPDSTVRLGGPAAGPHPAAPTSRSAARDSGTAPSPPRDGPPAHQGADLTRPPTGPVSPDDPFPASEPPATPPSRGGDGPAVTGPATPPPRSPPAFWERRAVGRLRTRILR